MSEYKLPPLSTLIEEDEKRVRCPNFEVCRVRVHPKWFDAFSGVCCKCQFAFYGVLKSTNGVCFFCNKDRKLFTLDCEHSMCGPCLYFIKFSRDHPDPNPAHDKCEIDNEYGVLFNKALKKVSQKYEELITEWDKLKRCPKCLKEGKFYEQFEDNEEEEEENGSDEEEEEEADYSEESSEFDEEEELAFLERLLDMRAESNAGVLAQQTCRKKLCLKKAAE
jgi:hypothetical protein